MKMIRPEDLPEDTVIVGSSIAVGNPFGEDRRECMTCHGPCWISRKNSNRKCQFMCSACALADPELMKTVSVTTADIQEFMDAEGMTGMDLEAGLNIARALFSKKGESHE